MGVSCGTRGSDATAVPAAVPAAPPGRSRRPAGPRPRPAARAAAGRRGAVLAGEGDVREHLGPAGELGRSSRPGGAVPDTVTTTGSAPSRWRGSRANQGVAPGSVAAMPGTASCRRGRRSAASAAGSAGSGTTGRGSGCGATVRSAGGRVGLDEQRGLQAAGVAGRGGDRVRGGGVAVGVGRGDPHQAQHLQREHRDEHDGERAWPGRECRDAVGAGRPAVARPGCAATTTGPQQPRHDDAADGDGDRRHRQVAPPARAAVTSGGSVLNVGVYQPETNGHMFCPASTRPPTTVTPASPATTAAGPSPGRPPRAGAARRGRTRRAPA